MGPRLIAVLVFALALPRAIPMAIRLFNGSAEARYAVAQFSHGHACALFQRHVGIELPELLGYKVAPDTHIRLLGGLPGFTIYRLA